MLRVVQFFLLSCFTSSVHHVLVAPWLISVSGRTPLPLTACLAASVQLTVKAQGLSLLHAGGSYG